MARIRTIKPEFWVDEKVVELSPFARLLFIGLWNFADDEGRMEYRPKKIKLEVLPADDVDVAELLGEIRRESLIEVYAIDGKEYLQIRGFVKHQKIDRRRESKIPPAPNCAELRRHSPKNTPGMEGNGRDQGKEGKEGGAGAPDYVFEGKTVRLKRKDYDQWRKSYTNIPDIMAELQRADDYYTEHPPPDGKWFFKVSSWLERANKPKIKGRGSVSVLDPPDWYSDPGPPPRA